MALKNKKTRRVDMLLEELRSSNFDPAKELIKLAKTKGIRMADKIRICENLMKHVYPTMKAVELDTQGGQPVMFNFDIARLANTEVTQ